MSEDEIQLERRLRQATAPGGGGPTSTEAGAQSPHDDPEIAALAESWQMLGQLLHAASADFRPEPLVRQLRWRRRRELMWRGVGFLAAALLIGAGVVWYIHRGDENGNGPNGANGIVGIPVKQPAKNGSVDSINSVVADSSDKDSTKSGWDQSLDEQIAQAGETVRSAPLLASSGDEQIDQLDQQLATFSQEIAANSL